MRTYRHSKAFFHWSDRKREQTARHRATAADFVRFIEALAANSRAFAREQDHLEQWQRRYLEHQARGTLVVVPPPAAYAFIDETHRHKPSAIEALHQRGRDGGLLPTLIVEDELHAHAAAGVLG